MASASRSITINFGDSTGTGPKDITVTLKNWCNQQFIIGAEVTMTIDGSPNTQISNASGQVTFLQVPAGSWPVRVVAAGYLDSDKDSLANDIITV